MKSSLSGLLCSSNHVFSANPWAQGLWLTRSHFQIQQRIQHLKTTRVTVQTLRRIANWTYRAISKEMKLPLSTVYTIAHDDAAATPSKNCGGYASALTDDQRQQLLTLATKDAVHRRMSYTAIARLLDIDMDIRSLRWIFHDSGYHRRIARKKVFLSVIACERRLVWALNYRHWIKRDWRRVIWSDEAAMQIEGSAENMWITRLPEEEYHRDCIQPKLQKLSSCMIWAQMSYSQLSEKSIF